MKTDIDAPSPAVQAAYCDGSAAALRSSGAIYHVIARGDGGKMVFDTKDDREAWLTRKGEACEKFGWLMHAWVLMGNHVHFLLETPEPISWRA